MSSSKNAAVAATLMALALTLAPTPALAYCPLTCNWSGYDKIPVYQTDDLAPNLKHADGTVWTELEVAREIIWTLEAINNYSNANTPTLYFAGVVPACATAHDTVAADCARDDGIVITPNAPDRPGACGAELLYGGELEDCPGDGQVILIERFAECEAQGGPGSLVAYEHLATPATWFDRATLQGFLMHELGGHALGLHHSYNSCDGLACSAPPCTVTAAATTGELHTYYRDDVDGLRAIYGAPGLQSGRLEESYGSGWFSLPVTGMPLFTPLWSLSSSPDDKMFAVYRDPSTVSARAALWDWFPITWADWGWALSASWTQGHVGSAWNGSDRGYAFWLALEAIGNPTKIFAIREYTGPGTGITRANFFETTRRHGVTGAFDPKSGALFQVSRDSRAVIQIHLVKGNTWLGPFNIVDGAGDVVQAYDTPTVACGDANHFMNCIVAWADPAREGTSSRYHTLKSMQFTAQWTGGGWNDVLPGPILSSGYIMAGSPSVSYSGPSTSSHPFMVAWSYASGENMTLWTMKKSASETTNWDTGTVEGHGVWSGPSMSLGSSLNHPELIHVRPL